MNKCYQASMMLCYLLCPCTYIKSSSQSVCCIQPKSLQKPICVQLTSVWWLLMQIEHPWYLFWCDLVYCTCMTCPLSTFWSLSCSCMSSLSTPSTLPVAVIYLNTWMIAWQGFCYCNSEHACLDPVCLDSNIQDLIWIPKHTKPGLIQAPLIVSWFVVLVQSPDSFAFSFSSLRHVYKRKFNSHIVVL